MSGGYKNRDFTEAEERQDYANEQAIARQLAVSWQCEMEKQPKFATFDYIAMREKTILAFGPICRPGKMDQGVIA